MSQPQRTAYITCPSCGGSGMQDYLNGPGDCRTCSTDTVIRARDEAGRFATVEVVTSEPHRQ